MKLKQHLDFLLSGYFWKLRLGPKKGEEEEVTITDCKNGLLSVSRTALELRAKKEKYTLLTKFHESETMKYTELIRSKEIYRFILKKYAKIVENMHMYLTKESDTVVEGIYDEAMNFLLLRDDL